MTILRLKNLTNIYRIDTKKTRRGARIPCSRRSMDQIKVSKVKYADSCGRTKWGGKNPRGRRRKRKKARAKRLRAGLKHHLGAIDPSAKLGAKIYGAKLGAMIYGVELPVKSPPRLC